MRPVLAEGPPICFSIRPRYRQTLKPSTKATYGKPAYMAKKKKTVKPKTELTNVTDERIEQAIHVTRGQRVMLDSDLAELYEVETKTLIRQVKRNAERFP